LKRKNKKQNGRNSKNILNIYPEETSEYGNPKQRKKKGCRLQ
jgi:hypothetical protein